MFTNTRKTKASPLPDINGQEIGHIRRRLFFSFFQNGLMFKEISSRQIFQFASFTKVTDTSPRLGTTPSARCGFCSLKNTSFFYSLLNTMEDPMDYKFQQKLKLIVLEARRGLNILRTGVLQTLRVTNDTKFFYWMKNTDQKICISLNSVNEHCFLYCSHLEDTDDW